MSQSAKGPVARDSFPGTRRQAQHLAQGKQVGLVGGEGGRLDRREFSDESW